MKKKNQRKLFVHGSRNVVGKGIVLTVAVILLCTTFGSADLLYSKYTTQEYQGKSIVWDATITSTNPTSQNDYVIFGEAPDADDGPPADIYDVAKPPAPMPPYIRAYLKDGMTGPYATLWRDYREYPDTAKVWNLSVQWVPEDGESPSTITISWSTSEVDESEYTTVNFCTDSGVILKNMLVDTSYSYGAVAWAIQKFKIICSVSGNTPPYTPNTPSPANGATGVSVTTDLGWVGGDPDAGDTVLYDVYFGMSSSPPKVVGNQSALSYDVGTLAYSTLYYWKIVAWDNHGASAVGPVWHFTTGVQPNNPPYTPNTPSPANGATGVSVTTDLGWVGGDPDAGDTVLYDVYFGMSSSPPKVVGNQSALSYDVGTLAYSTLYYWKIVAWDNHGASAVGPVWHFTTGVQPNNPPYTPNTPSPANGATGVSVTTDLGWVGGDPDAGDTVLYDVYFGMSSSPPKVVGNQSALSYDVGTLAYSTLYYWKIVAWDNHGASAVGPVWHFTTGVQPNNPPYTPNTPSPANGATGVSVTTDLGWVGGDPDAGDTVLYDVYFGMSSSPPKVVGNQSALSYDVGTLAYSTLYYWKIVAWDNHGASAVGPVWHFTTGVQPNNPPYTPNTPSPANGSTDVTVNTDLNWQGGDPDPGDTVTYNVYFGISSSPPIVSDNQSGLSYDPGTLAYTTTYYWRIVAWDNHGASAVGPLWHFTTAQQPNQPPVATDDTATVPFDSTNNKIDVLANDDDPDEDPLTITDVSSASHGITSTDGDYVYYTPTTGYSGADSFTYTIDDGNGGTDTGAVSITVQANAPPSKPQRPIGPTSGKANVEYTFNATTTDSNNHQVYYQWDWGDGTTSNWLGPFDSGDLTQAKHSWGKGSYSIKVKAKDSYGAESDWSEALAITMPLSHNLLPHQFGAFIHLLIHYLRGDFPGITFIQLLRTEGWLH